MTKEKIINQINWVMENVEYTQEKYRQLHELAWQLINVTREGDINEYIQSR
tara:strand:+ start:376 stop:528 length:153 start_codon:yes stop_codon:yes gene_type:complete